MLPVLADAACVCQLHVCPMSQSPALFPCEHLPECLVYRVTRKVCVSSPSPPVESGVGTLSHCPSCSETWGKSPFSRVPICALKGLNPKRVFQAVFCGAQKFLSFSSDGVRGGGQIFENHPGQTPSEDWLTSPFRLLWSCIPEPLLQAGGRRQKQELSERGLRCSLTHVKSGLGKAGQFHGEGPWREKFLKIAGMFLIWNSLPRCQISPNACVPFRSDTDAYMHSQQAPSQNPV